MVGRTLGLEPAALGRHVELLAHGGEVDLDPVEAREGGSHELVELSEVVLDERQLHLEGLQAVLHRTLH